MSDDAMEAEFGVTALWTAEAVRALGADHAIPAACLGSASPAALAWLGEACELRRDSVLVDSGAGMGGPAAFAAERFGVRPVLVEPMTGACRAAADLFGFTALAGAGERLPLADGVADAVWSLGVLCTTPEKDAVLRECRRVLRDGGDLGLLAFVADEPHPSGAPEGNSFPSSDDLPRLLEAAGFELVEQTGADELGAAPLSWTRRTDAVDEAIDRAHGDDPRHAAAQEQESQLGALLKDGTVTGVLLHATAR